MKSLCTCIVTSFLAASALSCGYASGQTTAESDRVQTYAIGQCKINVTLAQGSELHLSKTEGYVDNGSYGFSLNTTQMAKRYSELISGGYFKLYCQTGLPQDGVPVEWHRFDDTLVYMKNSSLIPSDSEKEFYGFELTGNNWKGVVTVKKRPPEGKPVEIGRFTKTEVGWDYQKIMPEGEIQKNLLKDFGFYRWNFMEFNK